VWFLHQLWPRRNHGCIGGRSEIGGYLGCSGPALGLNEELRSSKRQ
jgi:hypothetical protein